MFGHYLPKIGRLLLKATGHTGSGPFDGGLGCSYIKSIILDPHLYVSTVFEGVRLTERFGEMKVDKIASSKILWGFILFTFCSQLPHVFTSFEEGCHLSRIAFCSRHQRAGIFSQSRLVSSALPYYYFLVCDHDWAASEPDYLYFELRQGTGL